MKIKFRYDYNCKMLIICFLVSLLFFIIFVASYEKSLIAFCLSGILFLISLFNSIILIYNQGITVGKKNIFIIDYFWFTKINLEDVTKVKLKEIEKEKKSNWYGFIHEFYHPATYMYKSDYVYNNGRVFKIVFYLKDNSTMESYFGWMYREKSLAKVNKVVKKLECFVQNINVIAQQKNFK